jgi:hypothetical protein
MGSKPKKVVKKAPVKQTEITYNPVMSCNGGRHAYVCNGGNSPHLDTETEEFIALIRDLDYGRYVMALVETSSDDVSNQWASVYARLVDA